MAIVTRSQTEMDRVSRFFPTSFLAGLSRNGIGALGQDDYYSEGGSGWNWQGMLEQAPSLLRDLYIAKETGDYQARILELQAERARQGLSPLDVSSYAPRVNVGVAPDTMKAALPFVALGVAGLAGVFLLSRGKRR